MKVHNAWGAVGAIFGLIALYLVLVNYQGLTSGLGAGQRFGVGLITALQGRPTTASSN